MKHFGGILPRADSAAGVRALYDASDHAYRPEHRAGGGAFDLIHPEDVGELVRLVGSQILQVLVLKDVDALPASMTPGPKTLRSGSGSGMSLYPMDGRFLTGTSGAYVSTPRRSAPSATFHPPPSGPSPEPRVILVECCFSRNRVHAEGDHAPFVNHSSTCLNNTGLCGKIECGGVSPGAESVPINDGEKRSALLYEASRLLSAIALGTSPVAVKYAVSRVPSAALRGTKTLRQ